MGASQHTSTKMMKVLALVAALVVAAHASPLAQKDVTDFDKVSAMITDAQNDNFEKAAGYDAEMLPAWETPEWMGRRSNSSLTVSATLVLVFSDAVLATTQSTANTPGAAGYAFFACVYLKSLGLSCPAGTASPTTVPGIDTYAQTLAFLTSRRVTSTTQSATMATTLYSSAAAYTSAVNAIDSSALSSAAAAAAAATGAVNCGTASCTTIGTVVGNVVSGADRTTTFGVAALLAALFAQLF